MRNLKRMAATESFELLPDSPKACQVHNIVKCQTKRFLDKVKSNCSCFPWALMADSTELACGPEKEACINGQVLRDPSCFVPCAGLYADITEENFLLQLRRNASKTMNVDDDKENLRILTAKYNSYKWNYVKQLWFGPKAEDLSMFIKSII